MPFGCRVIRPMYIAAEVDEVLPILWMVASAESCGVKGEEGSTCRGLCHFLMSTTATSHRRLPSPGHSLATYDMYCAPAIHHISSTACDEANRSKAHI